ncbi:MAG: hydrogenase maturation protease [Syntrophobacteraceae bacterium]|jgi:hydrogenase maturation protease
MPGFHEQLQQCLQGRVCLMGLGNTEYGDDGFGVRLARRMAERLTDAGQSKAAPSILIAETMPERFIGRVAENCFDTLVFLDAVDLGGAPGSVVLLSSRDLVARFPQISTHKISLGTLAQWVEASGTMRAHLLGVQPGSLKAQRRLTPEVQGTVDVLSDLLLSFWGFKSLERLPAHELRPVTRTTAEEDLC